MRIFPLTALLLFLFSLTSFAEEDSWLSSFIGDAFKNDLEKAGTYRAHFEDNAYIDLKFDEDTAFITVVAFKQDKDKHKPWSEEQIQRKVEEKGFPYTVANIEFSFNPIPLRFIEDGFKVGYEIIDNKIYFDSPLAGIEAGNMGRVDNDFLTITFRKTKSLEELVFYKLVEKLEVGEWLYQYGFWTKPEGAIEACSTDWKEELPQMWRLEERKTLAIDKERLLLYESLWDEELFVIWESFESDLQVNPELYLIQIIDGLTTYGCLTPAPVGYKSYLISQGFEIIEEKEYKQILADEKVEKARLEEEKRLAEEEQKLAEEERKRREEQARKAAERKRKAEVKRLAVQQLRDKPFNDCLTGIKSNPRSEARRTPAMRNKIYEKLATAQAALERKDFAAARKTLDEMLAAGGKNELNSYELANVYNLYAFIYYSEEDYDGALRAYRNVIKQPNIPLGLERNIRSTVAQLYFVLEKWREGIDYSLESCGSYIPSSSWWLMMAQLYNSIPDYDKASLSLERHIELEEKVGESALRLKFNIAGKTGQSEEMMEILSQLQYQYPKAEYSERLLSAENGGGVNPLKINVVLGTMVGADDEYLPIVKVAPIYPRRAQTRGIEGFCELEYTVTKDGSVRDPQVVDCQPSGVFERASMKAALKFKYSPRIVDGEPVDVAGVSNTFTFELED